MVATSSGCLLRPNPNSSARLRLVCFPYAGGGVSAFAGWHKTLPSDVEVGYVQLAGRDGRRREAPVSDFRALIDDLTQTLSWNDDIPVAFFGVSMVPHRAVCNHLLWMLTAFPLTEQDRVPQKYPFNFDASICEIFCPLLAGSRLIVTEPAERWDIAQFIQLLHAEQLTVVDLVPSMLDALLEDKRFQA